MQKMYTFSVKALFVGVLCTLLGVFSVQNANAQCPGYFNAGTVTPPCGTYSSATFNPGGYLLNNVVAGAQYHWTVCGTSNYDTRISIYDAGGTTNYATNDDACTNASGSNLASDLVWTSTVTAQVQSVCGVYSCPGSPAYGWVSGMTSAVLSYRQENNITAPTPTSSAGTAFCSSSATTLTASPSAGSGAVFSYQWYKNGTIVSGQTASTYTVAANTLAGGTNTFYYIATLGQCSTTSGTLSVTVTANPTLTVGTQVCDGTTAAFSSSASVTWSASAGSFTGTNPSTSITFNPPNLTSPTVNQNVTITGTIGTCAPTATIRVDNTPALTVPPTVCDNLTAGVSSDIAVSWSAGSGSITGTNPGTSVTFNPPNVAAPTTFQNVVITGTNGACAPTATIRVDNRPALTVPATVCDNSTLAVSSDVSGTWSATSGSFTGTNPGTSLTYNPANLTPPLASQGATITVTNGSCAPTASVTVSNQPTLTIAPAVCDNSSAALSSDVSVTWSASLGNFSGTNPNTSITYNPPAIAQPTQFQNMTITGTNGACAPTGTIRVDNQNNISTANNTPVCDNTTLAINGDVSGVVWNVVGGGSVTTPGQNTTLTPPNVSTPTQFQNVTVSATNGVCTVSSITVKVDNLNSITTANNTPVCDNTTLAVNGDVSNVAWTVSSGSITTPGQNATVTPPNVAVPTQNQNITVTATNGSCPAQSITVRVDNMPNNANAGPDISQCTTPTFTMAGNTSNVTGATTAWACIANCTGVGITTPSSPTTTVTSVPTGTTTLSWTITNGACSTSDNVDLTNSALASISGPTSVCDDQTGGVTYNNNLGSTNWSVTPGSIGSITSGGVFTPANIATPTQSATGVVKVINGACTTNYNITVYNKPTITSSSASLCQGDVRTLTADVTGTTFSGTGVSFNGTNYIFTAPNPGGTSANYIITASSGSGCQDQQVLTVYQNASFTSSAADMCEGQTRTLTASIGPGFFSGSCGGCVSGTTFTAPIPSGNSATYTITYAVVGSACPSPTQNITVYAQPVLTIPATVCDASTAAISSTKNVTWSAASGSFSPGSGTSSTYTPATISNPTLSSVVNIVGTNGACSANSNITVYNNPAVTVPASVCDNSTAAVSSDISATWSAGSGSFTGSNPGSSLTYTPANLTVPTASQPVTITVTNGACAPTSSITVYNNPTLTIPATVCESSTAAVSSDLSVSWSAIAGSFSPTSGSSSSYSPANLTAPTASSSVVITGTNGACAPSASITVWNNANITSSAADMCEGSTRTLTADIGPGTWTADCGVCVSGTTFTAPTPVGNMATSTVTYTLTGGVCNSPKQNIDVYHTPSTANAGPDITNGCGLGTTLTGVAPTYGSGTWSQSSGPGSTTFTTPTSPTSTTTVSALGTYTYTWTVGNGPCATNSDNANVTYNTAMSASYAFDDCMNTGGGDNYYVLVSGSSGTPPYSFSGTPVGSVSSTQKIYEQAAGSSTTYTVTDNVGCTASVTPTAPSGHPTDIPFTSTTGFKSVDCYDQAINKWVTFRDNNNDAILSIQAGSVNLGLVNVTVYRDGAEPVVFPTNPSTNCSNFNDLKAMKRHFVMTSTAYPYPTTFPSNVGVRLYFSDAELQSLITASTGNNIPNNSCTENDDITSLSGLYVTKYSGPSEDGDYNNNNVSGVYKVYGDANGYGTPDGPLTKSANGFSTLFTSGQNHHYVQLSVDRFSEFWMYGSKQAQALPVEMIYFEANAVDNSYIQLKWATALEINNNGFWVERSVDGVNFTQIAWVDGHNNTTIQQNYSYDDVNVNANVRYYYRLKQMDNDGQFEYTDIVTAIITGETSFQVLDFVPNPTNQATTLYITSGSAQEIQVDLYNIVGQNVLSSSHQLSKGGNQIPFDLNLLASGTYTAVVTSNNEVHSKKLVISK
ncbi:MAG: T9SS type A sorting domain-containing protein [Chitinophagales bacterium]